MSQSRPRIKASKLAKHLVELLIEKNALQLSLLKVSKLTSYTDYLLIATGSSHRHVRALADHLIDSMSQQKIKPLGKEGYDGGQWILVDFQDTVVHIFLEEIRDYYDLDGLWRDAEKIPVDA